MNILITGAFGFVGTNLSKSLGITGNYHLTALDINETSGHNYCSFFTWEQLDEINWDVLDTIIHLAGKAHDTKNTTEEKAYFDINVGLTKQIFERFLQSNASKFIYFSSVKAVADSVKGAYLTEDIEPSPGTPYGRSKLEAERYVTGRLGDWEKMRKACHPEPAKDPFEEPHHPSPVNLPEKDLVEQKTTINTTDSRSAGLSSASSPFPINRDGQSLLRMTPTKKVYILRPAMIHGPGNKGNLNLLYKLVSKGVSWPLGAFENLRSFASIENLSFVIKQIIERNIEPGTYNMADDAPISTNRLIELIAESEGRKAHIWRISKKFIAYCAKIGGKLHLPLNTERLKKLTESFVVSNNKLKKALAIKKMPDSAEEGMRRTLESFQ
ncbi:MAG: NAD-dependent epimerase/dehydratase family protein [Prolixibacteraceae bacterium]|nr:NAD-dependent epimerase/dehydratase family protein [Prolixibacteraceae bacterium]